MSRKKGKSKAKGSTKSTPRKTPAKRHSSQPWPGQEPMTPKHSLADEARWMSSHRTAAFEAGKKLRHMPIQFISAGRLQGTIQEHTPAVEDSRSESDDESPAPSSPGSSASPDNIGAMAHMAIRSPSPMASEASSSADEVVFRGRAQPTHPPSSTALTDQALRAATVGQAPTIQEPTSLPTPQLRASPALDHTIVTKESGTSASVELSIRVNAIDHVATNAHSDANSVVQNDFFAKRRGDQPVWEGTTTPWEHRSKPGIGWLPVKDRPDMDTYIRGGISSREAAMDDYMQNMEEFGLTDDLLAASGFARREMDLDAGSHNDWESASASHEEVTEQLEAELSDSWDSDMLSAFDEMSTSSDVMGSVVRILNKRSRKSGIQYLCVYEGCVTDDARWLPATCLRNASEKQLLLAFEESMFVREQAQQEASESLDDDDDDDVAEEIEEDEEEESEEDEEFDDETVARVLQKQEELGLGSDEVLLYAGDEFFDDPVGLHFPSFGNFGRPNKKRQARVRGNRDPTFPSASAMADALSMDPYGGFDIMDTERPSLRPKKKGRRGQMPPELEIDDEDLNQQLQKTWAVDRDKKRIKKVEREERRQQGLLGRKGKGPNLKVKYQGGIDMQDIVEEIREFIKGDMQTLSLPPMEANRRATVHQAAAYFNLTSRSRGDGHDRFTVLSKTSRTRVLTDDEFDLAIQRKGFQKRLQGPLYNTGGARSSRGTTVRHGGRLKPQTGYKDGDTVGANAPELGPENKGHNLLSKMGWSKGTGLGALDNKGILQPIPHTVKTNKAGLQ